MPLVHNLARRRADTRFVQQLLAHRRSLFARAQLRRQHMLMANAGFLRCRIVKIQPAQLQPQARSQNSAPQLGHLLHINFAELLHGMNALAAQPHLHAFAYSGQVTRLQGKKDVGKLASGNGHQTIGFLHIGSGFGQETVGS